MAELTLAAVSTLANSGCRHRYLEGSLGRDFQSKTVVVNAHLGPMTSLVPALGQIYSIYFFSRHGFFV